jgi:hypothetical protein
MGRGRERTPEKIESRLAFKHSPAPGSQSGSSPGVAESNWPDESGGADVAEANPGYKRLPASARNHSTQLRNIRMKPEDMNTTNADGKAFNGNRGAMIVALIFVVAVVIASIAKAIL